MSAQQLLAVTLIDGLWQAPLIALSTWLVLRVFLRTSAALRHGTWFAALLACVVFPVLTASRSSEIAASPAFVGIAEGLWATVAAVLMLRIVASVFALRRAQRTALPVAPSDRASLARWNQKGEFHRDLRLCVSGDIESPAAAGLFDAMVLLPQWMLGTDAPDLDSIVAHELAHLRRYDDWAALAQRTIQAILFFNPAVGWIAHQLELEREVACDDIAVAGSGDALRYATCLTTVAREIGWCGRISLAPSLFSARKILSLRVERLLQPRNSATHAPAQVAALASAVFTAVLCASFALVPLATVAFTAPHDDPAVRAGAVSIYQSLLARRNKDPRLVAAGSALLGMGATSEFDLSSRRNTAVGSAFSYHARATRGVVVMQVRTDRRDRILGFTIEGRGTNEKRVPVTAYAYVSTGADLPQP